MGVHQREEIKKMKLPKYYLEIYYETGNYNRSRRVNDKSNYLNKIVAERALKNKIEVFKKNGYVLESGNESSISMWSDKQKVRAYIKVKTKICEAE